MPQPDRILYSGQRNAQPGQPLSTRSASIRAPESLDESGRSIRVVMSTEQPVMAYDYERWELVPEVLLADGMRSPDSGQVPFLDSHLRYSVDNVLGSARDFKPVTVNGLKGMDAQVDFSEDPKGDSAFRKYREGHLTDVSVGYGVLSRVFVEKGATATVAGKSYTGPVSVVTEWQLRELSAAPIGADDLAKARSKYQRQGGDNMKITDKLRKLLVLRGLNPEATDEQARTFLAAMSEEVRTELIAQSERADTPPNPAPAVTPPVVAEPGRAVSQVPVVPDAGVTLAEGARIERERIQAIQANCRSVGLDEAFALRLIDGGQGIDKCRELILAEMTTRSQVLGGRMEMGATDSEKFRAAAADALALRSGVSIENPAEGAVSLRGRSLSQLAEECLERAGIITRRLSRVEIAKRAFAPTTSSDFPLILGVSVNRVLRASFDTAPSTYEPWVSFADATDFKAMDRLQLSEAPDLELVNEAGEYKSGGFQEGKESYKVGKYGKKFMITYEAIVNDDLNALSRIPRLFGNAARRKPNELVYAILKSNAVMGDNDALFSTGHKNLAGTGAALSVESLSAGRKAMRKQKDLAGRAVLNLAPKFLLVPSDLETTADVLLRSLSDPAATNPNTVNPFQNKLQPIVEANLDVSSGAIPWYLASDPNQMDTIEVAFLEGRRDPWVDERLAFEVDGQEFKIRIIVAAKAIDHRGLYKNPGVSG